MRELAGRTVLVTGGAGSIGLALARSFAAAGAEPVLADLDGEAAAAAAVELTNTAGVRVTGLRMDVTDPDDIAAARDSLLSSGSLDVLVNNAGIVHGGAFTDVPLERHMATYRVNLLGAAAVTHAFLDELCARPQGHIVNIASAAGLVGLPWGASYASSKWGLVGLSESLRLELREAGHGHVGVTIVCPSYADTGMFDGVRPPRATRMIAPRRLAGRVVDAVLHERPYVLVPWIVRLVPTLRGLLPTRAFDALTRAFDATSGMRTWKGREQDRGEHD